VVPIAEIDKMRDIRKTAELLKDLRPGGMIFLF
jgi:hypothetical protein